MLTRKVFTTRGEVFTPHLGVPEAELTRGAMVKSLYEVHQINLKEATSGVDAAILMVTYTCGWLVSKIPQHIKTLIAYASQNNQDYDIPFTYCYTITSS